MELANTILPQHRSCKTTFVHATDGEASFVQYVERNATILQG
jgi:hypothetical protein